MKAAAGYREKRCCYKRSMSIPVLPHMTLDRLQEFMMALDWVGYDTLNVRDVMRDWKTIVFSFAIYKYEGSPSEMEGETSLEGEKNFSKKSQF